MELPVPDEFVDPLRLADAPEKLQSSPALRSLLQTIAPEMKHSPDQLLEHCQQWMYDLDNPVSEAWTGLWQRLQKQQPEQFPRPSSSVGLHWAMQHRSEDFRTYLPDPEENRSLGELMLGLSRLHDIICPHSDFNVSDLLNAHISCWKGDTSFDLYSREQGFTAIVDPNCGPGLVLCSPHFILVERVHGDHLGIASLLSHELIHIYWARIFKSGRRNRSHLHAAVEEGATTLLQHLLRINHLSSERDRFTQSLDKNLLTQAVLFGPYPHHTQTVLDFFWREDTGYRGLWELMRLVRKGSSEYSLSRGLDKLHGRRLGLKEWQRLLPRPY